MREARTAGQSIKCHSPKRSRVRTRGLRRNPVVVGVYGLSLWWPAVFHLPPESQSVLLGATMNDSGQRILLLSHCAGIGALREVWGGRCRFGPGNCDGEHPLFAWACLAIFLEAYSRN